MPILRTIATAQPKLYQHMERAARASAAFARYRSMGEDKISVISAAARAHGIGKPAIPQDMLRKPAPLTIVEWNPDRRHPERGAEMADRGTAAG